MAAPLLYEVNTRAWLRELSEQAGEIITLDTVPDAEIKRWADLGFTHVWLMGVWTVGPLARKEALKHWREHWSKGIPSTEADVHGSPYAIQDYSIDPAMGSPITLLLLRERMRMAGLKLILDFIPNHFGVDATAPFQYPGRFVQSASESPGTFGRLTRFGRRVFAHGRDPHFPPWSDTVQVDYRTHDTHDAMSGIVQTLAACSDGLRCDMAMLLLPDVFWKTWREFPPTSAQPASQNFWRHAIGAFRQINPVAELIAEVYWDREAELQECGFDYTYNKRVTDLILEREAAKLKSLLSESPAEYLRRSIHFLENHDERRVASALSEREHKAAAVLILCLSGMPLIHDGQMEGRREFTPIQMSKRAPETADPAIKDFYERLLGVLRATSIRRGRCEVVETSSPELVGLRWTHPAGETELVLVNLGRERAHHRLEMPDARPELLFETGECRATAAKGHFIFEAPPVSAQIWRIARGESG